MILVSNGGVDRHFIIDNFDDVLLSNPDVVIVEFGMNDHVAEDSLNEESLISFKNDISSIVQQIKKQKIDVILVGFFQQNSDWVLEKAEATVRYNKILNDVAEENGLYFADIYSVFEKIRNRKNIYEDVTCDYMHHPSDWGHMLYYSNIVPVFNVDNRIQTNGTYID